MTESAEAERRLIAPADEARAARRRALPQRPRRSRPVADHRLGPLAPALAEHLVVARAPERRLEGGGEQVGGVDPLVAV